MFHRNLRDNQGRHPLQVIPRTPDLQPNHVQRPHHPDQQLVPLHDRVALPVGRDRMRDMVHIPGRLIHEDLREDRAVKRDHGRHQQHGGRKHAVERDAHEDGHRSEENHGKKDDWNDRRGIRVVVHLCDQL